VVIKYDLDPTASYKGGVRGRKATSSSVTHKALRHNQKAVNTYDHYANRKIQQLNSRVRTAVRFAKIGYWFQTVYGGVAARVQANSIANLLSILGIAAAPEGHAQPAAGRQHRVIGATNVWPSLGGSLHAGNNVISGVIATGI
jgi:hypothetical protein